MKMANSWLLGSSGFIAGRALVAPCASGIAQAGQSILELVHGHPVEDVRAVKDENRPQCLPITSLCGLLPRRRHHLLLKGIGVLQSHGGSVVFGSGL